VRQNLHHPRRSIASVRRRSDHVIIKAHATSVIGVAVNVGKLEITAALQIKRALSLDGIGGKAAIRAGRGKAVGHTIIRHRNKAAALERASQGGGDVAAAALRKRKGKKEERKEKKFHTRLQGNETQP
jgi:hypothetical protein